MSRVNSHTSDGHIYRIEGARRLGAEHPQTLTFQDGELSEKLPAVNDQSCIEINANGCLILPGFIDLYSRCREPGCSDCINQ